MKLRSTRQFLNYLAVNAMVFLSLALGMPAMAMSPTSMTGMSHETSSNLLQCTTQHQATPGTTLKIVTEDTKEDESPQPVPYFTQFQQSSIDTTQAPPTDIIESSSYRPPDIIRLTNNIRF
jgi:hypothetical protein